jgi:hypothetical protein
MLKFLSANIGLIKTKLDDAMQQSHLIRHSTGQVLPNNLQQASDSNIAGYIGLGWFITTNFGHKSFGIMGLLLVVIMPIWPLILLLRGASLYCVVPTLRISISQLLVSVRMMSYHL